MKIDTQNQMKSSRKLSVKLAISATFTVEPLEESLRFWMQELDGDAEIEFAPYNQVFQQLLDPTSLLSQNQTGINLILIRFEDWQRYETSEADIQALGEAGLACRMLRVSDCFGDYGIVGVMIFGGSANILKVDSFLLSCRVLGRGVEHRMLNHLGEIAKAQNCSSLTLPYIQTKKNLPALNFLQGVGADYQQPNPDGFLFDFPVEIATTLGYNPVIDPTTSTAQDTQKTAISSNSDQVHLRKSDRLIRISTELYQPEQVLNQIESQLHQRQLEQPVVQPRPDAKYQLAQLWMKLLRVETVGITNNYFDLGGTSLLAVELFAQIESQWGHMITNKVRQKVTNLVSYEVQSKVDRFWTQLQMRLLRLYLDRKLSRPQFLKNIAVANTPWALSYTTWQMRRVIQGKLDNDLPKLLGDFIRNSVLFNRQASSQPNS